MTINYQSLKILIWVLILIKKIVVLGSRVVTLRLEPLLRRGVGYAKKSSMWTITITDNGNQSNSVIEEEGYN